MLKKLYIDRISTLKKEIKNAEIYFIKRASIIEEYIKIIENLNIKIAEINNDKKKDLNIKYIELNEKTSEIEKVTFKIEELTNENITKVNIINKSKYILIQSCIEDHTDLSEKEILLEIEKLLSK